MFRSFDNIKQANSSRVGTNARTVFSGRCPYICRESQHPGSHSIPLSGFSGFACPLGVTASLFLASWVSPAHWESQHPFFWLLGFGLPRESQHPSLSFCLSDKHYNKSKDKINFPSNSFSFSCALKTSSRQRLSGQQIVYLLANQKFTTNSRKRKTHRKTSRKTARKMSRKTARFPDWQHQDTSVRQHQDWTGLTEQQSSRLLKNFLLLMLMLLLLENS